MYTVIETDEFGHWLASLKERTTRIRLARRLNKARRGNLGDINPVGEGVMEMREFFGPGWRLYYVERTGALVIMLGGGDKSSQTRDLEHAKQLAKELL